MWTKANIIKVHRKESRQGKRFAKRLFLTYFIVIFVTIRLITSHQSGFRPGDSTINQLLSTTHKIYSAFEEVLSKETRTIFLDFSKAFDRVWHEGLLYKLTCRGYQTLSKRKLRECLNFLLERVWYPG